MNFGLLSLLIWLPIVAGIVVLFMGSERIAAGRWVALIASLITFVASLPLIRGFDSNTFAYQFVEKLPWIPAFKSYYALGVDGIAMPLIVLTTLITVPVIVAAWTVIEMRPAQYYAAFLIM